MGDRVREITGPLTSASPRSLPIVRVKYDNAAAGSRIYHCLWQLWTHPIQTIHDRWHRPEIRLLAYGLQVGVLNSPTARAINLLPVIAKESHQGAAVLSN